MINLQTPTHTINARFFFFFFFFCQPTCARQKIEFLLETLIRGRRAHSRLDHLLLSDAQQHQFPGGATSQQRYGYPKENFGYLRFAGYNSLEYLRFPGCKYFGYVRFPGYKKLGHEVRDKLNL